MELTPTLAALAVALVPGSVALRVARHPARGLEHLGLTVGLSLAIVPLAMLYTTWLGIRWSPIGVRGSLGVATAVAIVLLIRRRNSGSRVDGTALLWDAAAVGLFAIALVQRWLHADALIVPAWVDGYHHTVITDLIMRSGGIPAGFEPYLADVRFYYHYGFHAIAASVSWLVGAPPHAAVIATGQILNALTTWTAWLLAWRLTGSRPAAVMAAAVPAALHYLPGYYVTWGRYTQLAGLVAMAAAWSLLWDASMGRGGRRSIALASIASAGLVVLHYRVTVMFAVGASILLGALAVGMCGRPTDRRDGGRSDGGHPVARWIAVVGCSAVLVGPWLATQFWSGLRSLLQAAREAPDRLTEAGLPPSDVPSGGTPWYVAPDALGRLPDWLFTIHINEWLLVAAVFGAIIGLMRGTRAADGLVAWTAISLLIVYPGWIGLPATWMLPPFALAIAAWLPVALGCGLLLDAAVQLMHRIFWPWAPDHRRWIHCAVIAGLIGLATWSAAELRTIINPTTILFDRADQRGMRWIEENTPQDARFLIPVTPWHLGTFRGLDGGYWIPYFTGRSTTLPNSFYAYGNAVDVARITALGRSAARGDALSADDLARLAQRANARWIYMGPRSVGHVGRYDGVSLGASDRWRERYRDGEVQIFEAATSGTAAGGLPEH